MPDNDHRLPRKTPRGEFPPNPPAAYVELGVATPFSFLRGASDASDLAETAHRLGYDALGVADLNTMAGVVRLHAAARRASLRPVIGCRLRLVTGEEFLAYPRDRAAYGRLCRLLTRGKRQDDAGRWQAKGACDIGLADLAAHAEGVQLIVLPDDSLAARLPELVRRLPGLRHIAVSYLYRGDDRARITRLDRLARAHGLGILATNDVHYHAPDRRPLQDVMTCIREKTTIQQAGFLLEANAERHLKSPAEMARLFADWPQAIHATREVADACRFGLEELAYHYPQETVPPGETAQSQLEKLTWDGAAQRYPEGVPQKVRDLLARELEVIRLKKIPQYFLTVHEIVLWARARNILCQGRGSAANSAVCFVLGITSVDPAEQELLFERFISMDRDDPPDIDVDFEHERREEVIQYLYAKYGRERAALAATVITYRPKSAMRDIGKALGFDLEQVDRLSKSLAWWDGRQVLPQRLEEAGFDPANQKVRLLVQLLDELIGFPRHLSQHVGGFVIARGKLSQLVPIENAAMVDRTIIQWDKDDLDALGLLKVDVLALGMLSAIRRALDEVSRLRGRTITMADIPREDPAVYEMIGHADTVGVFQIESRAQMSMLPRMRPRNFYDLVIEVAIVRPGPIQGGMVHPYLRRREGSEAVTYPSEEVRDVLQRTLGVPIFQEQVMRLAVVAAGFTPGEADAVRRSMAAWKRKGGLEHLEQRLIDGMTERGYQQEFALQIFQQILGFGEYGFPESHAASFALLVYISAWLKCHEPAAFTCALLNSQPMGFYAPTQLVQDVRRHGVEVLPADVTESEWDCTLTAFPSPQPSPLRGEGRTSKEERISQPALRLGLRMVNGLSLEGAARLTEARSQKPFDSVEDMARRAGLEKRDLKCLAAAGALSALAGHRRQAYWDVAGIEQLTPLALATAGEMQPQLLPLTEGQNLVADYDSLGLTLGRHPLALLRDTLRAQRLVTAAELRAFPHGRLTRAAGLVIGRQRPGTASGVTFVTLEDETGQINVVVWRDLADKQRRELLGSGLLAVFGVLERQGEVTHLIAGHLKDLTPLLGELVTQSRDFH